MRGKIIILARYDSHNPYLGWDDFVVENHWSNTGHKKIEDVKKNIDDARAGNTKSLYLTFTNYVGISVKITSKDVNPAVYTDVRNNPGRIGIIVMDYPGPQLIRGIINHNF